MFLPSEKQIMERKENIASILQCLRDYGPQSRRQLSKTLGLSWGCISELSSILLTKNIVLEDVQAQAKSKGRSSAILRLNDDILFLGVDVNKIGLKASICNLLGEKLLEYSDEIDQNSKDTFLSSINNFVNSVLLKHKNIVGICFAMQGIFDKQSKIWQFPAKDIIDINFEKDISVMFDVPTIIRHDPDCVLYGCFNKNEGSKMVVRLDSGVGVSIFKNNAFLNNELFEMGYFVINSRGDRLHKVISKSAFETAKEGGVIDEHLELCAKYLGIILGNICNFIRLDEIYFCGELVDKYNLLNNTFQTFYFSTVLADYKAKISKVAINNASYGAAKMAMDDFSMSINEV